MIILNIHTAIGMQGLRAISITVIFIMAIASSFTITYFLSVQFLEAYGLEKRG